MRWNPGFIFMCCFTFFSLQVASFRDGEGAALDSRLRAKDKLNKHTSYISGPWSDMYLCDRRSVCFNHNPGIALADDPRPGFSDPAIRASNLLVIFYSHIVVVFLTVYNPQLIFLFRSQYFVFTGATFGTSCTPMYTTWLLPKRIIQNFGKIGSGFSRLLSPLSCPTCSWHSLWTCRSFPTSFSQREFPRKTVTSLKGWLLGIMKAIIHIFRMISKHP